MSGPAFNSPEVTSPLSGEPAQSRAAARPRRFRLGLGTLLLLLTIVALAIAQFASTRRVAQYQAENLQLKAQNATLRVEAGYLEVTDPDKVAVLQIPQLDALTWQWKVYLPKGQWEVHNQVRNVSQVGVSGSGTATVMGEKQAVITASVRKGLNDEWELVIKSANSSSRSALGKDHRLIGPNSSGGFSNNNVGLGKVEVFDPDKPIELIRLRTNDRVQTSPNSWTHKPPAGPTDGILIWIKRVPSPSVTAPAMP